jgi:flavin reductase (DIM6/NTAB) family NADH-FMN oxidoreductase RutF
MRTFKSSELTIVELQSYLNHIVAPRPIALVSTIDAAGNVNLSPFSFFNLFSCNPPMCVFSPSRRVKDNTTKHTLQNLLEVPECVIHVVNHDILHQTSLSSTEYDKGVNEFGKAGFTELASTYVKPPRVAESPVQMECVVKDIISLGDGPGAGNLVLAEIIYLHINENVMDAAGRISQTKLDLVGRMGADLYTHTNTTNIFSVPKPLMQKGIGIDQLPEYVKNSSVLTGNDLAQLANVTEVPAMEDGEDYLNDTIDLRNELSVLQDFPESRTTFVHQRSKSLIRNHKLHEAWLNLLAGIDYEEKISAAKLTANF